VGLFFCSCAALLLRPEHDMHTTKRALPEPTANVINMSSLTKRERLLLDNVASPYGDPHKTLDRKIELLARLLNCTEEEATYELLHRL
jgi:hypothetical protein